MPGKEPKRSTRLSDGTAPGPHPGISIISHFQETSPPNSTPSQTTPVPQVSGPGRQRAAQLLPTMQPLRRSQSRSEEEGAAALPAARACCSPPQLGGHCLPHHLCTCSKKAEGRTSLTEFQAQADSICPSLWCEPGGFVCNKIRAFSVRPTQCCIGPGSRRVRKPFPTLLQLNRRDGYST